MQVTNHILSEKINQYLEEKLSNTDLAHWAEDVMVDGDYQEEYFDTIADAISSIASIDVKGFELSNEFFYEILEKLK